MAEQERIENAISDEELDAVSGGKVIVSGAKGLGDKQERLMPGIKIELADGNPEGRVPKFPM